MTDDKIALSSLLEKSSDSSFLREMIGFAAERLMQLETGAICNAAPGERSADRRNQRNGYRDRGRGEADQKTIQRIVFPPNRVGTVELRIPKLRRGSYFPAFTSLLGHKPPGREDCALTLLVLKNKSSKTSSIIKLEYLVPKMHHRHYVVVGILP